MPPGPESGGALSRILFDQNCPRKLRPLLVRHEITTAAAMGWATVQKGDLLRVAEDAGFAVLITADQSMRHQQNLKRRKIALVVLPTNYWPVVRENATRIAGAVGQVRAGDYVEV